MEIDTEIHKKILLDLIDRLITDYGENDLLVFSKSQLIKKETQLPAIKNILYGILSFYFIDEITLQPAEKINLIDMGSYYYRSESYSIDFPHELHKKYQIPYPHTERKASIFYSDKNFVEKYLAAKQDEKLISISILKTENHDLKMPSSRQLFMIEYFILYPSQFEKMIVSKYSSKFKDSTIFKIRKEKRLDSFFTDRIINDLSDGEINKSLEAILDEHQEYVLTSSGTAANQLVIQYLNSNNQKSFYHKYWYFENLGNNRCLYFYEISGIESSFDNFFINIQPTNFIDEANPFFFETIKDKISTLFNELEKYDKDFFVVIDVTSNPFFSIQTRAKNIHIVKTISLSKYQEGVNTSFAGAVIADDTDVLKMKQLSDYFGFTINELDKRFMFLQNIGHYKERIQKIENFTNEQTFSYLGWKIFPNGLSVILVPDTVTSCQHIKKFTNQTVISDRKFAWILRDRVNELISELGLKDIFFGDSFLFPTSRINIQGPVIKVSGHNEDTRVFKYRLPRISPGYETNLINRKMYNELYKGVVDIYTDEYSKL